MRNRPPMYYDDRWDHGSRVWQVIGHLVGLLVLVALVTLVVVVVLRLTRDRVGASSATAIPADPAIDELRLRYARSEVSREEYLSRLADLRAARGGAGEPPPAVAD